MAEEFKVRTRKEILLQIKDAILQRKIMNELDVECYSEIQKSLKRNTDEAISNNNIIKGKKQSVSNDELLLRYVNADLAKIK